MSHMLPPRNGQEKKNGEEKPKQILQTLENVKQGLQLDDELPLVVGDILAVELLEAVDGGARDEAVEHVLLLELAAVGGLVAAHLYLDGHGGLALLADGDLLVVALDGRAVCRLWWSARQRIGWLARLTG